MKLSEIIEYAKGEILNSSVFSDDEVVGGCGADLMSDVLTSRCARHRSFARQTSHARNDRACHTEERYTDLQ